jgi:serine protease
LVSLALIKRLSWIVLIVLVIGCGNGGSKDDGESDDKDTDTGTAPVATFSVSADSGMIPLSIEFDASETTDSDGTIVQYDWDFGDGSTGSGIAASHTYSISGTFTAQLTATDDDGLTSSQQLVIDAKDPSSETYTISGTVRSAEYVVTDTDVNDTNTTPVANDSFDDAQTVTAPVTVSGYVNVAGAGIRGNSWSRGDPDDYFLVAFTQGMAITLYMVEDLQNAELNLYLYDDQQKLTDAAVINTQNGYASLSVPQDGTYYVRVQAVSYRNIRTATGYTLTLGKSNSVTADTQLRLSDDFVPGEVLIRLHEQDSAGISTFSKGNTELTTMGLSVHGDGSGRERLLRRSDTVNRASCFKRLGVEQAFERSVAPGQSDTQTRRKMETLWLVRAMRLQSGVSIAEPNYIRKPLAVPNDEYYAYQWHYPLINLPDAWEITTGDNDVVVAVVDTGVLLLHPDLSGQLVDGYDFISDEDIALDGDGVDDDPDDPGDNDSVYGSSFHGTHVAGTIAAASNNDTGVAGIAWNTRIMPLRALGYGGGTSYDIIQAVKYAAGLETDYDGVHIDEPVDVINLSLGGESYSQVEADVYQTVRNQGVIVVAAAGNDGTTTKMYPAAYDGVVSVSAITIDETIASYSNTGSTIDVAAPGGSSTDTNGDGYMDGVLSTIGDDSSGTIEMGYGFYTGTSMAAPHVSAVIALMKAIYPTMTPEEFDSLLEGGYLTQDMGDEAWDSQFGYGLIDAHKAVLSAQDGSGNDGIPAILSVSPSNLSFGATLASAEVTVENSGNTEKSLSITGYTANASWLSVEPGADVDDQGIGTYTISVNRDGLADGTYSGNVTITSDANAAAVAVVMQVGSETAASDGGYHYILLLDPDSYETIDQVSTAGENGVYDFSFSELSYGDQYVIYAGTDPNGDRYLCSEGESCGAYLSLDEPSVVTIQADLDHLDFSTDVIANISNATTEGFTFEQLPLQIDDVKEVTK